MKMDLKLLAVFLLVFAPVYGQFYEDKRCRCICPSLSNLLNRSMSDKKVFTSNVPPNQCNCEGVILPAMGDQLKGHEQEFCPRCECKYEKRNTTVIMVVVIMLVWVLMVLFGYMGFLMCLDPMINKRRARFYQEAAGHNTEESRNLLLQEDPDD